MGGAATEGGGRKEGYQSNVLRSYEKGMWVLFGSIFMFSDFYLLHTVHGQFGKKQVIL